MSPFRERNASDGSVREEKKRDNEILKPAVYTDFFVYKTALCTKVRNQKAVRNVFI